MSAAFYNQNEYTRTKTGALPAPARGRGFAIGLSARSQHFRLARIEDPRPPLCCRFCGASKHRSQRHGLQDPVANPGAAGGAHRGLSQPARPKLPSSPMRPPSTCATRLQAVFGGPFNGQEERCIVLDLLVSIRPAAIVGTGTFPARPQSGAVRRSDLLLRARSALLPAGARNAHALYSSPDQPNRFAGVPARSSA